MSNFFETIFRFRSTIISDSIVNKIYLFIFADRNKISAYLDYIIIV
jgi:hypothetical protein